MQQRTLAGLVCALIPCVQPAQTAAADVTAKQIKTISYWVDHGGTTVNLNSTGLILHAGGTAKVKATPGLTTIRAEVDRLSPPSQLGPEFLTYVLWALSPEWRPINLGSFQMDHKKRSKVEAATHLHSFALIVTAEPYGSVRRPSEVVVLENDLRKNTKRKSVIMNEYLLLKRSQYEGLIHGSRFSVVHKYVAPEIYGAHNAVDVAVSFSADQYASSMMAKARLKLTLAEKALKLGASRKDIVVLARQAAEFAEDARMLSVERQEQERIVRGAATSPAGGARSPQKHQ